MPDNLENLFQKVQQAPEENKNISGNPQSLGGLSPNVSDFLTALREQTINTTMPEEEKQRLRAKEFYQSKLGGQPDPSDSEIINVPVVTNEEEARDYFSGQGRKSGLSVNTKSGSVYVPSLGGWVGRTAQGNFYKSDKDGNNLGFIDTKVSKDETGADAIYIKDRPKYLSSTDQNWKKLDTKEVETLQYINSFSPAKPAEDHWVLGASEGGSVIEWLKDFAKEPEIAINQIAGVSGRFAEQVGTSLGGMTLEEREKTGSTQNPLYYLQKLGRFYREGGAYGEERIRATQSPEYQGGITATLANLIVKAKAQAATGIPVFSLDMAYGMGDRAEEAIKRELVKKGYTPNTKEFDEQLSSINNQLKIAGAQLGGAALGQIDKLLNAVPAFRNMGVTKAAEQNVLAAGFKVGTPEYTKALAQTVDDLKFARFQKIYGTPDKLLTKPFDVKSQVVDDFNRVPISSIEDSLLPDYFQGTKTARFTPIRGAYRAEELLNTLVAEERAALLSGKVASDIELNALTKSLSKIVAKSPSLNLILGDIADGGANGIMDIAKTRGTGVVVSGAFNVIANAYQKLVVGDPEARWTDNLQHDLLLGALLVHNEKSGIGSEASEARISKNAREYAIDLARRVQAEELKYRQNPEGYMASNPEVALTMQRMREITIERQADAAARQTSDATQPNIPLDNFDNWIRQRIPDIKDSEVQSAKERYYLMLSGMGLNPDTVAYETPVGPTQPQFRVTTPEGVSMIMTPSEVETMRTQRAGIIAERIDAVKKSIAQFEEKVKSGATLSKKELNKYEANKAKLAELEKQAKDPYELQIEYLDPKPRDITQYGSPIGPEYIPPTPIPESAGGQTRRVFTPEGAFRYMTEAEIAEAKAAKIKEFEDRVAAQQRKVNELVRQTSELSKTKSSEESNKKLKRLQDKLREEQEILETMREEGPQPYEFTVVEFDPTSADRSILAGQEVSIPLSESTAPYIRALYRTEQDMLSGKPRQTTDEVVSPELAAIRNREEVRPRAEEKPKFRPELPEGPNQQRFDAWRRLAGIPDETIEYIKRVANENNGILPFGEDNLGVYLNNLTRFKTDAEKINQIKLDMNELKQRSDNYGYFIEDYPPEKGRMQWQVHRWEFGRETSDPLTKKEATKLMKILVKDAKQEESNRLASQTSADKTQEVMPKVKGTPDFLPELQSLPKPKSITEEIIMENIGEAKKKWQNIYEQYLAEAKARSEGIDPVTGERLLSSGINLSPEFKLITSLVKEAISSGIKTAEDFLRYAAARHSISLEKLGRDKARNIFNTQMEFLSRPDNPNRNTSETKPLPDRPESTMPSAALPQADQPDISLARKISQKFYNTLKLISYDNRTTLNKFNKLINALQKGDMSPEDLFTYRERGDTTPLNERERAVVEYQTRIYDKFRDELLQLGIIKEGIPDFAPHLILQSSMPKDKNLSKAVLEGLKKAFGEELITRTSKGRTIDLLSDLKVAVDNINKKYNTNLRVVTDPVEAMKRYLDQASYMIHKKKYINELMNTNIDGKPAIVRATEPRFPSGNYGSTPNLFGYVVNKDILPDVKDVLGTKTQGIFGELETVSANLKAFKLGFDIYHITTGALSMAFTPSLLFQKGNKIAKERIARELVEKGFRTGTPEFEAEMKKLENVKEYGSGIEVFNSTINALVNGDPTIRGWIKDGLIISSPEDYKKFNKGIGNAIDDAINNYVPAGLKGKIKPVEWGQNTFDWAHTATFEKTIPLFKVATAEMQFRQFLRNYPNASEAQIAKAREAIIHNTNVSYGGQNFLNLINQSKTKIGRILAEKVYRGENRRAVGTIALAQDWLVSQHRLFRDALLDIPNLEQMKQKDYIKDSLSGLATGLLKPKTIEDHARRRLIALVVLMGAVTNATQYALTGRLAFGNSDPSLDNKDPFTIETKDGSTYDTFRLGGLYMPALKELHTQYRKDNSDWSKVAERFAKSLYNKMAPIPRFITEQSGKIASNEFKIEGLPVDTANLLLPITFGTIGEDLPAGDRAKRTFLNYIGLQSKTKTYEEQMRSRSKKKAESLGPEARIEKMQKKMEYMERERIRNLKRSKDKEWNPSESNVDDFLKQLRGEE